ncbi:PREDICTED: N-terminal Xaa-Pro-Lys N-methyltransferase 1 [Polistes canadensis]|uniref:N-terminal Xaa-Pro-Lys N-methyltransferase 1 n=1 Tax=Polistes canadensis TaxID=91411 RepID=UPI000718BDB6|nr:PREDICTED: N-terminal Xaa-Pro-Lys N-methyltransferase 1 [Polistes canadensis]
MEVKRKIELDNKCYKASEKYWDRIPPTINGMLGGFGFLSGQEIDGSSKFLSSLFKLENPPSRQHALDCGAGIGRVTKKLLIKYFENVDLLEQNPKFIESAKTYLRNNISRIGFHCSALQNFHPTPQKYDVIWCQWVLGYINDEHLVGFLKNCVSGLKKEGVLVVKENVTRSDVLEFDKTDSSITRPYKDLVGIFDKAGLICIQRKLQKHMPLGLYPVYMFALKPKNESVQTE